MNAVLDMVRNVPENDLYSITRALEAILKGSSLDDVDAVRGALTTAASKTESVVETDSVLSPTWQSGGYPYQYLLSRKS
ncbi:MAG: polyphosphate kinase 2, partial [bacterium]